MRYNKKILTLKKNCANISDVCINKYQKTA